MWSSPRTLWKQVVKVVEKVKKVYVDLIKGNNFSDESQKSPNGGRLFNMLKGVKNFFQKTILFLGLNCFYI